MTQTKISVLSQKPPLNYNNKGYHQKYIANTSQKTKITHRDGITQMHTKNGTDDTKNQKLDFEPQHSTKAHVMQLEKKDVLKNSKKKHTYRKTTTFT